jgi:hypothetical protein
MLTDVKPITIIFNFIRSEVFRNIVLALALLFSIYNFIQTRGQNRELNDMQYIIKATEIRPTLKALLKPEIISITPQLNPDYGSKVIDVYLNQLKTNLKINNTGNDVATIIAQASTDAYDGDPLIRDIVLGKNTKYETELFIDTYFWGEKQLQPGDAIDLDFNKDVSNMSGDSFIRHYWVLYKNSAGMLYDIYYWSRFTITEVSCTAKDEESHAYWFMLSAGNSHKQCFVVDVKEDAHISNHIYNPVERKVVNQLLEKYRKASEYGFEIWHTADTPFGKLPSPNEIKK